MGSREITLDHNVVMQLWDDPFFWETVPELEGDREIAEALLVNAETAQNSLIIKHSDLYNKWIMLFNQWVTTRPDTMQTLTNYIHKRRGNKPEVIKLPSGMILSKGHGAVQ